MYLLNLCEQWPECANIWSNLTTHLWLITHLFLEHVICIIRMLYLQSIPSCPCEGRQIHAVGLNNNYVSIYELSPPPSDPIPTQLHKHGRISRMLLCLAYCLHHPLSYNLSPSLPPFLPAASASRTPNTPLNNLLHPSSAFLAPSSMIYKVLPKIEGR